jgi:hypothetical protein
VIGSASGNFDSKNVGAGKVVSVSGNSLSGADAGNYKLIQQTGLRAAVTPATLTYTATPVAAMVGRVPAGLTGSVSGLAAGETLAQATTGTLAWTTLAGAGGAVGTYPVSGGGLSATNYVFAQAASNATALNFGPAEVPTAIASVATQMVANARTIGTNGQLPAANAMPIVTTTWDAAGAGSTDAAGSSAAAAVNSTITFDTRGTTLKIVNGGTRLPDNLANEYE